MTPPDPATPAAPAPPSSTESVRTRLAEFVPRGLSISHPIAVTRAEGTRVWDADGREYLDFASGIGGDAGAGRG